MRCAAAASASSPRTTSPRSWRRSSSGSPRRARARCTSRCRSTSSRVRGCAAPAHAPCPSPTGPGRARVGGRSLPRSTAHAGRCSWSAAGPAVPLTRSAPAPTRHAGADHRQRQGDPRRAAPVCRSAPASGLPPLTPRVNDADLLVVVGSELGDSDLWGGVVASGTPGGRTVIRIDLDPAQMHKNVTADLPVVGDAATVLGERARRLAETGLRRPSRHGRALATRSRPRPTRTPARGREIQRSLRPRCRPTRSWRGTARR